MNENEQRYIVEPKVELAIKQRDEKLTGLFSEAMGNNTKDLKEFISLSMEPIKQAVDRHDKKIDDHDSKIDNMGRKIAGFIILGTAIGAILGGVYNKIF